MQLKEDGVGLAAVGGCDRKYPAGQGQTSAGKQSCAGEGMAS